MVRLVWLQVFDHATLAAIARSQQQREVEIPALRGSLLDRTGQPLAKTLDADSVAVNPQKIRDTREAAWILARALRLDEARLTKQIDAFRAGGKRFLWVARKLAPEEAARVRALNLDYVEFRTEMRRYYPHGTLAAHVLGSVGFSADSEFEHGNAGVELSYEQDLAGRPGRALQYTDSRQDPYESIVTRDPSPGADLTLTIDPNVQYAAERHLEEAVRSSGARAGSVVALDPQTGDILALANYPSYDPNVPPGRGGEAPGARNNLAISTPFEPGSVFKVITLAAALENTSLTPQSMIDCGNGSINLFGRVIHDHDPYKFLSVADVLAKSSNIGAIQIALATGGEKLYEYQKRFGFGRKTGVELPGESAGVLWPPERWTRSSIGSLAMGHEVSVTSLQLAVAGAAIANGGVLVRPRLVLARQRPGQPIERFAPEKGERVLRPETAIQMRSMMEGVVLRGTGSKAVLPGYTSGGKTGSAQIYDAQLHAYTHTYNASFLGFAPVANPRIVVAVALHGTSGGTAGFGGVRAAPVFRTVATEALRMLDVPKDLPVAAPVSGARPAVNDLAIAGLSDSPAQRAVSSVTPPLVQGEAPVSGASSLGQRPFFDSGIERGGEPAAALWGARAPDFRGKTVRAVLRESTAAGVPVELIGSGLALSQEPPPGAPLRPSEPVRVRFGR
jgi:cell division protein FtsI (penicillin-binding protein 3)